MFISLRSSYPTDFLRFCLPNDFLRFSLSNDFLRVSLPSDSLRFPYPNDSLSLHVSIITSCYVYPRLVLILAFYTLSQTKAKSKYVVITLRT